MHVLRTITLCTVCYDDDDDNSNNNIIGNDSGLCVLVTYGNLFACVQFELG